MLGLPDKILFFTISFLHISFSFTFLWPLSLEERAHTCGGDTQIQCQHCKFLYVLVDFRNTSCSEVPVAPYFAPAVPAVPAVSVVPNDLAVDGIH